MPKTEYATIAHQIATYPEKIDRGFVFTANNFYLCCDIDENSDFTIDAALPIEGNEDLINIIRENHKQGVVPIYEDTEGIASAIDEFKSRGRRNRRNISSSERQRGGDGGNVYISLRQQSISEASGRLPDNDGEAEDIGSGEW